MSSLTPMASAGCWPPRKNSPWGGSEGEFRARLLGLAVLVFRGDRAKDADLLVLRQENCAARNSLWGSRTQPPVLAWASMRLVRIRG